MYEEINVNVVSVKAINHRPFPTELHTAGVLDTIIAPWNNYKGLYFPACIGCMLTSLRQVTAARFYLCFWGSMG